MISQNIINKIFTKAVKTLFSEQWLLAYSFHGGDSSIGSILKNLKTIEPPAGFSWADPFPVFENSKSIIFFEEYSDYNRKGIIRTLTLRPDQGPQSPPVTVLSEDFHLSYPFVFKWIDKYYMIPETIESGQLRIYEAVTFPYRWQFKSVIMENVYAADPTLLEYNGIWWLFTSLRIDPKISNSESVSLFYADTPLGPWRPHKNGIVKSTNRSSRPAGRPYLHNGALYRPAQDCALRYGHAISVNRIDVMTPDRYEETEIYKIQPTWRRGLIGTHTLNITSEIAILDGLRWRLKAVKMQKPSTNRSVKKKIAFYTIGDRSTPSTRFRVLPYLNLFKKHDWQVTCHILPEPKILRSIPPLLLLWQLAARFLQLLLANRYDIVIIQKGLTPWRSRWLLNYLFKKKIQYLYDFDDAIYVAPPVLFPERYRWLQDFDAPKKLMQHAAGIIAGNTHLASYIQNMGSSCSILPTPIDCDLFQSRPADSGSTVVIGWTGMPSTNFYLNRVIPILNELGTKYDFSLLIISSNLVDIDIPSNCNFKVRFIPWKPETYVDDLNQITIGIMPLTDDEWSRGKCAFKALQYMALEKPVVVSPVGMNNELVSHGVNGLLAGTDNDWTNCLERLIIDKKLRDFLGKAARKTVVDNYSVNALFPKFENIIRHYMHQQC